MTTRTFQTAADYTQEECTMFHDTEHAEQWLYNEHDIDCGEDVFEVDCLMDSFGVKLDTWYSDSELEDFVRGAQERFN